MPGTSPVTYFVLGLNFLLFGVSLMATIRVGEGFNLMGGISGEVLLRLGARQAYLLFQGEWWRLVMPMFLHGGLMHLMFNSIVLMDVGPQLEELYGSARYLFLYVATGVASFVVSTAWSIYAHAGMGISIGASGALMGLIGLMLAITQRRGGAYMQMIRGQLIRWIIYITILGFFFRADHAAHFGGLAAGFLLGRVMEDGEPATPEARKRAYLLAWLAAGLVIASFAAMLLRYFRSA
jgi:rhomboid protease GluP